MTEITPNGLGGGGEQYGQHLEPDGRVTPVQRGEWYTLCPVWWCGKDWSDGYAWIEANGPPCRHIQLNMHKRADGSYLQFMRVAWFPRLRAVRFELTQWVLGLFRSRRL